MPYRTIQSPALRCIPIPDTETHTTEPALVWHSYLLDEDGVVLGQGMGHSESEAEAMAYRDALACGTIAAPRRNGKNSMTGVWE